LLANFASLADIDTSEGIPTQPLMGDTNGIQKRAASLKAAMLPRIPPSTHCGVELPTRDPIALCRLAIDYWRTLLTRRSSGGVGDSLKINNQAPGL